MSASSFSTPKNIWLDCDPGHDDAVALLLALELDNINLLGVSCVNGNSSLENTTRNAAKLLAALRAPKDMPLHRGAPTPIGGGEYDEAAAETIHGESGLDGVVGLPSLDHPEVQHFFDKAPKNTNTAAEAMTEAIRKAWNGGKGDKVWVVATGPTTNCAELIEREPQLVQDAVAGWVVMGGAFGIPQWTPVAEFNVHTDPAALQALLRPAPFPPVILAGLNITHTAIFREDTHRKLLDPSRPIDSPGEWRAREATSSDIRWTWSTLLTFFAKTYFEVFGFTTGPPVHDALCIGFLSAPEMFKGRWCALEVGQEHEGVDGRGETRLVPGTEWVADVEFESGVAVEGERPLGGKANCFVLEELDNPSFWQMFLDCVDSVEKRIATDPLK